MAPTHGRAVGSLRLLGRRGARSARPPLDDGRSDPPTATVDDILDPGYRCGAIGDEERCQFRDLRWPTRAAKGIPPSDLINADDPSLLWAFQPPVKPRRRPQRTGQPTQTLRRRSSKPRIRFARIHSRCRQHRRRDHSGHAATYHAWVAAQGSEMHDRSPATSQRIAVIARPPPASQQRMILQRPVAGSPHTS